MTELVMKYQQYDEYKDSGVEWLGEIPSSWRTGSLRWMIDIASGESLPSNCEKEYSKENQFPVVGGNGVMGFSNKVNTADAAIAVGRVGALCGNIHSIDYDSWITDNALKISKWNKFSKDFLVYLLKTANLNDLASKTAQPLITGEQVKSLKVVLLPIAEQKKIANFLDYETAQIDTLIDKQQTLIQLLKEKRQAVISHAVTKGLNPDAPMKDSGVEWLGEVPEHWEVLPAKRFFRLVAEPAPSNNDYELLSVYTAIGVRPRKDLEQKGNKASTTDGYWKVKKGDIVVNKLLAWMGAVGYSDYEGVTSPAYDILRATKDINSKFYHYLFRTRLANMEFKRWSRGIMEMRLRLYFDELGRIFMPLPSKQEQDLIVKKIEKMDNQFDDLIKKSEYNIQLMQERRTALISAAVTGKIDVRGWRAPE